MHKRKTFIIIAVLAAIWFGLVAFESMSKTNTAQTTQTAATVQPIDPNNIFELVNNERVKTGLSPLVRNAQLDASAKAKCDDLVTRNYWSHEDPDGKMPWHLFIEAGYKYAKAGENLAKDYKTAQDTVSGWMNSPKHKENIVNSVYRDTGVAVCGLTNMTVQHFGVR